MSDIEFHNVAKTTSLDEDEAVQVLVNGQEIAIYNLDGTYYATDDICTHAYASLADGYIEGTNIECPLHGGCFDIKTGKATTAPCTVDLKTYEVKIEGEDILVGIPSD
jgi:nitrite reductase/ring-hydroxylating ferredoxin subunit